MMSNWVRAVSQWNIASGGSGQEQSKNEDNLRILEIKLIFLFKSIFFKTYFHIDCLMVKIFLMFDLTIFNVLYMESL